MTKTTKTHFDLFKKEFKYWSAKLGLFGWRVEFRHEMLEKSIEAQYVADSAAMFAVVSLAKRWTADASLCVDRIAYNGFHEAMHLFLFNIDRGNEAAEHAVIQKLALVLWEPDYEARK